MNIKALLAEFIGTFALIFIGVGAVGMAYKGDATAVALAHGLTIAVMVSALGAISGGHFNPAISFGLYLGHRISTLTLVAYWIAQVAGGICGAWLIHFCLSGVVGGLRGTPGLGVSPAINPMQGAIFEAVGTFFLVLVVYGTAVDHRAPRVGGLFIGLTITLCALAFGPSTGSSINPARFLGPALVEGRFADGVEVYILGPLVGGALAGILYNYVMMDSTPSIEAEPAAA